jgi:hypothetical protein
VEEQGWEVPRPEVFDRYVAGEELTDRDHLHLQSYLLSRCLGEIEHVCSNTQMQMAGLSEVLEKVDVLDTAEGE